MPRRFESAPSPTVRGPHPFRRVLCLCLGFLLVAPDALAEAAFGYTLETDVVYGRGLIGRGDDIVERNLLVDIYHPSERPDASPRPAVILVHGGAFHRGGRRHPPYREAGAVHARMEDYARLLAPLGYVCFVVEYRLAPESPTPRMKLEPRVHRPLDDVVTSAGLRRTNYARKLMGLRPLADDEKILIWNAAMSAVEDVTLAVEFVREHADRYDVDPARIAMGGHSAGGGITLNVAYGMNAPLAAIFPLSPAGLLFELRPTEKRRSPPPALVVVSQNDEPAVLEGTPALLKELRALGAPIDFAWVAGFPHFYPTGAVSLGSDGERSSVGDRVVHFLEATLE